MHRSHRIVAVLLMLALCCTLLGSCAGKDTLTAVRIAYRAVGDDTTTVFAYDTRQVFASNDEQLCYLAVQLALSEPEVDGMTCPAPEQTKLRSIQIGENGIITVDLSHSYNTLSGIRRTVADYCIAQTLFEIGTVNGGPVNGVVITVENDGDRVVLRPDDIVDSTDFLRLREHELRIYFPDADSGKLVEETFLRTLSDAESPAEAVVEILMSGQRSDGRVRALVTARTKFLSLDVRNRTCFLNFSKEFLDLESRIQEDSILILYAFVNSLCALDYIDRVQFLIEGETTESVLYEDFDEPYVENMGLVG